MTTFRLPAEWPIHELKVDQPYFEAVNNGYKPFEVRFDDRGFQPGDHLLLREWNGIRYTGRSCDRVITFVLQDAEKFGLKPGFVVLGLKNLDD